MNAYIEIKKFQCEDIITTSTVEIWSDGNVTPPTKEEP